MFFSFLSAAIHTVSKVVKNDPITIMKNVSSVASQSSFSQTVDAGLRGLSIVDMFLQANFVVQLVMMSLILASVWSWIIIITKFLKFRLLKHRIFAFKKMFKSGHSLDSLLEIVKKQEDKNPLAQVLIATFDTWDAENRSGIADIDKNKTLAGNFIYTKEYLEQTMQLSMNKSLAGLQNGLESLATIGSNAPFVGLFGTVWGIMTSFQAIAAAKNTSLAIVAPGIAEALLATAFGLIAAIPAVIFYNKFSHDIAEIEDDAEDFRLELSTMILKEMCN